MSNKNKAILFMLLAAFSFAMMSTMVKLLGRIPTAEKVFFRSFISAIIMGLWVWRAEKPFFGQRSSQWHLLGRASLGTLAMSSYFYGVNSIHLADASMLNKLNPFFITLFAWIFLGEKPARMQWPALSVVFLASLLIIKPRFSPEIMPALAVMGSAMFSGGAHVLLRDLRKREHPLTVVFYFSAVSALLAAPFAFSNFVLPRGEEWLYLFSIGLFATSGQFGLTNAYKRGRAAEVSIYNYTNVLFAAFLGFLIWGEISDFWSLVGGIIIIAVSIGMFFYNSRRHRIADVMRHKKEKSHNP